MLWDRIPMPKGMDADFAVAVTDDSLAPWVKKGGTAYLRRRTELSDGDIGLFETDGGIVFRLLRAAGAQKESSPAYGLKDKIGKTQRLQNWSRCVFLSSQRSLAGFAASGRMKLY